MLHFEQEGFTTLQRTESVPWQDFVRPRRRGDDALHADVIAGRAGRDALHRGRRARRRRSDDDGARQATLMFDPGTDATMTLPNGTTQPLGDTLEVRATEYTRRAPAASAMPGELPDTSAYTYAVEFSVDQAVEARRHRRRRSPSRSSPTSTTSSTSRPARPSPPRTTTRRRRAWVPVRERRRARGRLRDGGMAQVDVDGDGAADSGAALAELGIDDAELTKLAQQLRRRRLLWRVAGQALHAVGLQLALRLQGATARRRTRSPPPPPYCPECQARGLDRRLLQPDAGRAARVTGTPFALDYDSGRSPGYKEAYTLDIPLTGRVAAGGRCRRVDLAGHGRRARVRRSQLRRRRANLK